MRSTKSTLGLAMIVRNEAAIIERCLDSVKQYVDHWTIVDTGSTDATPDIIRRVLGEIPGALYDRPWVDFGTNRTELMALAKDSADFLLLLDADHVVDVDGDWLEGMNTWADVNNDPFVNVWQNRLQRLGDEISGITNNHRQANAWT